MWGLFEFKWPKITCLLFGLFCFGQIVALTGATASLSLPLDPCVGSPDFFCIRVGGDAFKFPIPAHFDTGGISMSVPKACLKEGAYRVIRRHVVDGFGHPSAIVEGSVSLLKNSQAMATVPDFQFFANETGSCQSGFKHFGAGLNLEYPIRTPVGPYCLGSFFVFYGLENPVQGAQGYQLVTEGSTSGGLVLKMGPLAENALLQGQFQARTFQKCGGKSQVTGYFSRTQTRWKGTALPGFQVTIGGRAVPSTDVNTPNPASKFAMIDSGGGPAIMSDDSSGTINAFLNASSQGTLVSPAYCPARVKWLENCACLKAGVPVEVSAPDLSFQYHYISSDPGVSLASAVAVCPPYHKPSLNPDILPNGINLGYQAFVHGVVSFDVSQGRVGLAASV